MIDVLKCVAFQLLGVQAASLSRRKTSFGGKGVEVEDGASASISRDVDNQKITSQCHIRSIHLQSFSSWIVHFVRSKAIFFLRDMSEREIYCIRRHSGLFCRLCFCTCIHVKNPNVRVRTYVVEESLKRTCQVSSCKILYSYIGWSWNVLHLRSFRTMAHHTDGLAICSRIHFSHFCSIFCS